MTSLQPQSTQLPTDLSPLNGIRRWWTTLQCETSELWQNLTDRNTGKIYRSAFHKTWELISQVATILLLLLLTVVVAFCGAWLLGFQAGRQLRAWLETDNPTPKTIFAKLLSLLLLPFQVATIWLDRTFKQVFGWDLKLAELLPPADPDLLPQALTDTQQSETSPSQIGTPQK
jgi:hypothetical protein